MTNREYSELFDGSTYGTYIYKLFWIAGSIENSEFKDFLEELDDDNWKQCLPEFRNSSYYEEYQRNNDLVQALIDLNKFGFIAELRHPKCYDFDYNNNNEIIGHSVSMAVCRISYVYAENHDEMMAKIQESAEKIYNEYIKNDK